MKNINWNALIVLFLGLLDAFLYGFLYEIKKIKAAIGFVVWVENPGTKDEKVIEPVYRVFMFLLDVAGAFIVYLNCHVSWQWDISIILFNLVKLIPLFTYALCMYFPVKDAIYYLVLGQIQSLLDWKGKHLYWLEHGFQAGYWIFKDGFSAAKLFVWAAIIYTITIITMFL